MPECLEVAYLKESGRDPDLALLQQGWLTSAVKRSVSMLA